MILRFSSSDTNLYNISEKRSANTFGLKADYAFRPAHEVEFKFARCHR